MSIVDIVTEPIDEKALLSRLDRKIHGAVVTFQGTVRQITDGREVKELEYEAYRDMALKKMWEIEGQVRARWPIEDIAMVHRTGRLQLGEASVVVVVAANHRAEAFEACRYAIDQIKEVVPIWKKEVWADEGARWVRAEAV